MSIQNSAERQAWERQLQASAAMENEGRGQGLGIGCLLVLAIPAWAVLFFLVRRLIA